MASKAIETARDGGRALESTAEIFKALSSPMRLEIMARIAAVDELACTQLEASLPITKSTLSYHMRQLYRAGLVNIRREGQYFHYSARRDDIEATMSGMAGLLADLEEHVQSN